MNTLNQEADMGYVRDFVQKIAEALVAATELPNQIKLMQNDLDALHGDLEKTKARNMELDTLTADLRRQRDEAEQALSQVKSELSTVTRQYQDEVNTAEKHRAEVERLNARLEQTERDRDTYGLDAMAANDRAQAAEAKLAKLAEALGLPKPQPVPEPAKYYQDVAKEATAKVEELTKPALSQSAPQAVAEPTQAQPEPTSPKRVYEGDYNYYEISKGKPEHFDVGQKRYYVEV